MGSPLALTDPGRAAALLVFHDRAQPRHPGAA